MENTAKQRANRREQQELNNRFRKLWEQHVMWTRSFIISTAANPGDLDFVTKRLLRNPADFADTLKRYCGSAKVNTFREPLEKHLLIGAALVNAAKAGNNAEADKQRKLWIQNTDEISAFLASINPYWNKTAWRNMLYEHLRITEEEAAKRLTGQYASDIALYDMIEKQALMMADAMSDGIIRQFKIQ